MKHVIVRALLLLFAILFLVACTTNLGRSWVAPDMVGASFEKFGVVAFTKQEAYRMQAEDALVQEMGGRGMASHTVLPGLNALYDTAAVVDRLREVGCDGIITLQLKSASIRPDTKAQANEAVSYGQAVDDYWVDPSAQRTESFAPGQFFSVEVHVFDLQKRKMVYNGLVIERNAKDGADLVRMVRRDVLHDLQKKDVIRK